MIAKARNGKTQSQFLRAPLLWCVAAASVFAGSATAVSAGEGKQVQPAIAPQVAPSTATQPTVATAAAQHQADIDVARARCTVLLKSIAAVFVPHDTIDEGDCGTLAPIVVSSVGKNPEVAIVPPVIVTCELAVALHDWVKTDIQPLARKFLGQPIARMETMSSYSCRNAYGRKMSKLSEHGRANAVDIRGFVMASGKTAFVLENWGLTSGEIRAASAAAEKEQAVRQAEAAATAQRLAAVKAKPLTDQAQASSTKSGTAQNPLAGATTIIEGLPTTGPAFGNGQRAPNTDFGLSPSKLGGPKQPKATAAPATKDTPVDAARAKSATVTPSTLEGASDAAAFFLRAVHDSACQRFATTLGPETNAAHRNHFHVDLAERKTAKRICD